MSYQTIIKYFTIEYTYHAPRTIFNILCTTTDKLMFQIP